MAPISTMEATLNKESILFIFHVIEPVAVDAEWIPPDLSETVSSHEKLKVIPG